MPQTGPLQLPVVVRFDVFENGQHVGAMHPAGLPVFLLGELVEVVDFLLDGGRNGADVEAALALALRAERRSQRRGRARRSRGGSAAIGRAKRRWTA